MKKIYRVGCSGYYYPNWKNKFYPPGLQPKNWLEYYSTIFNTVELNGTFYRTPELKDLKKYNDITSEDFKFSVKMSKYITHNLKLKDCKKAVADFQDLISEGLEQKLNCFLFQLPPSYQYTEENLERILNSIPHKNENVVELRHPSWWNDGVQNAFKNAKLTFCNVDFPGLDSHFMQTSAIFYLRLHGNPELFKSSYSNEELSNFYDQFPEKAKEYNIYFNNTYYEAGYKNALELMDIIKD